MDNQRSEFVARATMGEESLSALCRKYGISRPTGYKWLERYKGGETMLDRPHTPFRKPFKTSPDVELRQALDFPKAPSDHRRKADSWSCRIAPQSIYLWY